ncbi:hypothetical protein ACLOJK_038453 [Asimina triloba]
MNGECNLENMRTLCVACHSEVTAAQRTDRRLTKMQAKEHLKLVMKQIKDKSRNERLEASDFSEKLILRLLWSIQGALHCAEDERLVPTPFELDSLIFFVSAAALFSQLVLVRAESRAVGHSRVSSCLLPSSVWASMLEVLKNSAAMGVAVNEFCSQWGHPNSHQTKGILGGFCCDLVGSSKWKVSRRFSTIRSVDNARIVIDCCHSPFRILPKKVIGMKQVIQPMTRWGNFVMIADFEPDLLSKEEAMDVSIQKSNIKPDTHEEMSKSCGNLVGCSDKNARHSSRLSFPDSEEGLFMDGTQLHFLEERNEEILSKRMVRLCRSNKVRSALELYMSMEASGLALSVHAYNSLLSCLLRGGSIDAALRVFHAVNERGMCTYHTYSLILKGVAVAHGYDSALRMFAELEEKGVLKTDSDAIVYNTMISVCGKAKDWIQMERVWRRLEEDGYSGTEITYRLLVCSFVRCRQDELAIEAYLEMISNQLKPSEDVMKAIVGASAKEGKWQLALRVFEEMLEQGLKPNAVVHNALINCLGQAGKIILAFKIYNLMKSSGHAADGYTWCALLTALYRGNRCADALVLFEAIRTEGISEVNDHLYNVALMCCQRLRLWGQSLQLLWQMEASGVPISTVSYNHVIETCEVARKPKVALQVYKHMIQEKCSPDTFTYLSLIRSCIWDSLWNEAVEILNLATPNASIYNVLIQGMCLRGRYNSAKNLYQKMQRIGLKSDGKTRALMDRTVSKDRAR